jgi:hypothetical protein
MLRQYHIKWVIIGGFSGGKTPPQIEWIKEIVEAADRAGIPVFLKKNLKNILPTAKWSRKPCSDYATSWDVRQELPEVQHG